MCFTVRIPSSPKSHIYWPSCSVSLEKYLRAIIGIVFQAEVLILPQIKLNLQLSHCVFFYVNTREPRSSRQALRKLPIVEICTEYVWVTNQNKRTWGFFKNYFCSQDVVISVALELVHWILKVMQPNFTITVWGRLGASELYIIKLYKFTPSFSNNP